MDDHSETEKGTIEGTRTNSVTTSESQQTEEAKAFERRLVWKIDLIILPLLVISLFLAQMGHSDIANAKIAGMDEDLHLTPARYSNMLTSFIVGYIVFQPAATMFLRYFTPPLQLGGAMLIWGTVTICHVAIKEWVGMTIARLIVGAAESLCQGALLYLSFWYTYNELAFRGALFQSIASLAGAFNGMISYGIAKDMGGRMGWAPWQWIFFVEGVLPVGFAFFVATLLPSLPEKNRFFFSAAEKTVLVERTRRTHNSADSRIRRHLIWKTAMDPKLLLISIAGAGNYYCTSTLQGFLPEMVKGMGIDPVKSQLMTVIVYFPAVAGVVLAGWYSDRYQRRSMPIIASGLVQCAGYIMYLASSGLVPQFVGCVLIAVGGFPILLLCLMWLVVNTVSYTKRAVSLATFNIISQIFGIIGSQAYRDAPLYKRGQASSLGMTVLCMLLTGACMFYLKRKNVEKQKRLEDPAQAEQVAQERETDYDIIGDDHPDFMFTI